MDWRWSWFWSILWNILIHAVTFQWGELGRDGEHLRGWWQSLWSEITHQLNAVRSWAYGWIDWIRGHAENLANGVRSWAWGWIDWLRGEIPRLVNDARAWAWSWINWLRDYAYQQYLAAVNWARPRIDAIMAWARPYVDYWIGWLRGLYEWVQPYRDLITRWLTGARSAIDWLRYHAWGHLQAFLSNPLGYVLGWLIDPIVNLVNWWRHYGPMLADFVANQLPNLLNLLAAGYSLLRRFVDRPGETILELIADTFVDWAMGVIADRW